MCHGTKAKRFVVVFICAAALVGYGWLGGTSMRAARGQDGSQEAPAEPVVTDGPLTANPGGPYAATAATRIEAGWTFTFDGSGSSGPQPITTWEWDFGTDGFPGRWLNTQKWLAANAYCDDMAIIGGGGWGNSYVFSREPVLRRAAGGSPPPGGTQAGSHVSADFDGDGDVDLNDFSVFQNCFSGPNRPPADASCAAADLDADNDVDLSDFQVFQESFNGPNRPPANAAAVPNDRETNDGEPVPGVFQARVTPDNGEAMWGFKNTSTNYSYTQMPYALYFANGSLHIYEDGSHRGNFATYTPGQTYDLRIELKPAGGARYLWKLPSDADWTLLRDTDYGTATSLLRGATVASGTFRMDDVREVFYGKTLTHKVYHGGTATLTVKDSASASHTAAFDITVDPPDITANAGGPYTRSEGDRGADGWTFNLDGTASTSGLEIVQYEWDFGADTFDGDGPDPGRYFIARAYQSAGMAYVSGNGWGNNYLFARDIVTRSGASTLEARVIPDGGTAMWGFKNTNANYSYTQMPYALYFEGGNLRIYEDGSHRGQVGSYTPGQAYDVRIRLKNTSGALYFIKPADAADWTLLYDSYYSGQSDLLGGVTVNSGRFAIDEQTRRAYGPTPQRTVSGPTPVTLTVTDLLGRTASQQVSVDITGQPPVADAGGPYSAGLGESVLLDGTRSTDDYGIVRYEWDLGTQTFDGGALNPDGWYLSRATQDNRLLVTGANNWGDAYAFSKQVVSRATGVAMECRVLPSGNHAMYGFKNLSTDYSYTQMPYALYFNEGSLQVYEDGSGRGTVGSYSKTTQYDVRIVLKETAGATYWIRPTGTEAWTCVYDTSYGTATQFLRGVTVHSGVFETDDFRETFSGSTVPYLVSRNTTARLTVQDAKGQTATASVPVQLVPMVVCVPWDYDRISGREVPHNAWDGLSVRLKAVVYTDTPASSLTVTWDFGDGTAPETNAITDKRVIETTHVYRGDPGALYTATITVHDPVHGDLTDTYPVQIHAKDLTIEVNVAIDEGLWSIHKQNRGGWWDSNHGYWVSPTASCVHALEINGHTLNRSRSIDPLIEDVAGGLRSILSNLYTSGIGAQPYGDPDSNGNGLGVFVNSSRPIYEGGMVMDALAASGVPDWVADVGGTGIKGRTLRDIAQDMMDGYAWGQVDSGWARGGWRYGWNSESDNSAAQWAAIGFLGVKAGFGLDVAPWVKQENNVWLNNSYNGTGFGYTGAGNGQATTPSGMIQLAWAGFDVNDPRWRTAEAWVANNWDWFRNTTNVYAWYAFAKAMRVALPKPVVNLSPTGMDWYGHPTKGMARLLLNWQRADGSWPPDIGWNLGSPFNTAWSVVILTPTLFTRPPVAIAGQDIVWAFDRPLEFDGSKSYHTDPVRVLVLYEWDFDGDGTYDYAGTDPKTTHTYAFDPNIHYPITYQAKLRVTDDAHQTATDTRDVTIAEPPHAPFAKAGGPYTVSAGVPFHPNGSGSYDIDPTDYITRQEWDFNGANGYNFDQPDAAVDCTQAGCPQVTWVFNTPGIYNIGLRVWDNGVLHPQNRKLASVPDYTTVTVVQNQPPVANPGGPYTVDECKPLTLDGSGSTDPNGDAITYAWDLDDDGEFDDSTEPAPTFTRNQNGTYTVRLIVSDGALQSAPAATQVVVRDTTPTISLTGPNRLGIGQEGTFTATVGSPCDAVASIQWDWDYDGVTFRPSGDEGTPQKHSYTMQGSYRVAARVTDGDGSTALAVLGVTVEAPAAPRVPAGVRIKVVVGQRDYDNVRKVHRGRFSLVSVYDRPITGPVALAFDNLRPDTVKLLNTQGKVRDPATGRELPYIDFSDLLTGGKLAPGATLGPKWIEFEDPSGAAFTFDAMAYIFNAPPKFTSTPVTTADEGQRYRYDADAVDDDGDPVTFALRDTHGTPAPQGMTVHPLAGLVDWVPSQTAAGVHDVTLVALDGFAGGEGRQTFQITVGAVDVPPMITSTPLTTAQVNAPYQYQVLAHDPDGGAVTFALPVAPAGMTIDANGGMIQWAAPVAGSHAVKVVVADSRNQTATQEYTLVVVTCGQPPQITSQPPTTATEGEPYTYAVVAALPGATLAYSLPVAPDGMTIDAAGLISWTPSYTSHGMRTVKVVVAKDQGCQAEQIFQINVADVNAPPRIVSSPVESATEGRPYRYNVQAVDPDGDTIAFSLAAAPAGMTIQPVAGIIEWMPSQTAAADSPYTVTIEAADPSGAVGRQTFRIAVAAEDVGPQITSTPNYLAIEGRLYEYAVLVSDPDNEPLTYALTEAPAGMTITAAGVVRWTPGQTAARSGPYPVRIVVSDPAGHSATQAYELVVRASNVPPEITSTPVTVGREGDVYRYQVTATDVDGDVLRYSLTLAPGGMNIHPTTGAIDWRIPQTAAANNPTRVTVAVSDGAATTEQSFEITVEAVNVAPMIFSTPVTRAAVGAVYQYDVDANDVDGDTVTYALSVAPDGMTIDPATGVITWQPAVGQDGPQSVTVTAADPANLTDEQTFVIEVAPCPDAPEFTSEPKTTASPDVAYRYEVKAKVATGSITYALTTAPDGMSMDAQGVITWTPTQAQMGTHDVVVVATRDAVCPSRQAWQIEVKECELAVSYAPPPLVPGNPVQFAPQITSNCGPLTFELASGPAGMKVNTATGVITWTPVLGPFAAEVRAVDAWGTAATAMFNGEVVPQTPPRITSVPATTAKVNDLYSYQVVAVDDDGDAIEFALVKGPAGMTMDPTTHRITWTPDDAAIGTHPVEVRVTDARGASMTQSFAIAVSLTGTNRAPEITSTPPTPAYVDADYTYAVAATDPDGDSLTYSLPAAPPGMTIDAGGGLVTWHPTAADVGSYAVTVKAEDGGGGWATQSFTLEVKVNTPPTITSAAVTRAIVGLAYRYDVKAVDPDEPQLAYALAQSPAGMAIDAQTGTITWTPAADQAGDHAVLVSVKDSRQAEATQAYTVTVFADAGADLLPPEVAVAVQPKVVDPGEPVTITVTATDDFGIASVALTVNDAGVVLDPAGRAQYTPAAPGPYVVKAVATDLTGKKRTATTDFSARAAGDAIPPTVAIMSPEIDAELKAPTNFVGTASDANLYKYTLAYRPIGENEWVDFATGYTSVTDGVLGRLDPTKMVNGLYDIRLRAEDTNGNVNEVVTACAIAGQFKVGNFTITFTDVSVPLSGLPITVTRTYDSRDKTVGDFGVGWRMELSSLKVTENSVAGKDWEQQMIPGFAGMNRYVLTPIRPKVVSVTWPDGTIERFAMSVSPSQQMLVPIAFFDRVVFTPVPPATSRLEVLGDTSGYYDGGAPGVGDIYLYSDSSAMDPASYRLTAKDGTKYTFVGNANAPTARLQSLTEPNGNSLQITLNGIVHSSGKGVTFERDDRRRITAITDPKGGTLRFTYDERGDLVAATNAAGDVTRYTYDGNHGLVEIIDPRGVPVARNEYDDDGRLIATIDADGRRTEFQHDVNNRQEVVRDRNGNITVNEYDEAGNLVATTDALGQRTVCTYDARGNKLTETDPLGHTVTQTYDAADNVLSRTDALGNRTEYTYDAAGRTLTTRDPMGNVTRNTYDARGNLLSVTEPGDRVTTYTYDAAGRMTSRTDPLGRTTTYEYDGSGNLVRETDPLGHAVTYTYDANGNRLTRTTTRTTPAGPETLTTTFVYDANNRLVRTIDPAGNETRVEYTPTGQKAADIDALGRRTAYEYDERGHLVRTLYPDGTEERTTYDAEGRKLTATDRAGRTTTYAYDKVGRLVRTTWADGTFIQNEYDAAGRVIREIDERGNATRYAYDAAGRRLSVTDALGGTAAYEYDALGNRIRMTDARGNVTRYEYDARRQLVRTTFADGTWTAVDYDAAGRKVAETDQAGRVTRFTYDANDRLLSVTDALGGVTRYAWDEVGNQISQTDALGRVTRFEYDKLGRRTRRILPNGAVEVMTYDAAGRMIAKTDFAGRTITFEYDLADRLVRKNLPSGASTAFTWTPDGLRKTAVDARGVVSYEYDQRGRLVRQTEPDGRQITYAYDARGNRTAVTSPAGTTAYTYDALNRLETVTDPEGGVTRYTYDAVGNRSGVSLPNGTAAEYTYDAVNRLTRLVNRAAGGQVLSSYEYTLGPRGNRTRVVEHSGRTVDYVYDALYRLIEERVSDPVEGARTSAYTYDAVGNRLTMSITTAAGRTDVVYTYDANDRLITQRETVTLARLEGDDGRRIAAIGPQPSRGSYVGFLAFAAATAATLLVPGGLLLPGGAGIGRRVRRRRFFTMTVALFLVPCMFVGPENVYAMHAEALLYKIVGTAAVGQVPPATTLTMTYDANGNMIARTDGVKTDDYTYDDENRLVAANVQLGTEPGPVSYQYDANGVRVRKTAAGATTDYLVDSTLPYAQVIEERTGAATVSYVYGDERISMKRPGAGTRYYHYDGQMSTRVLSNAAGTATDTYTYDAFGVLLGRTGTTPNSYLFTGEAFDANIGFYYLRARYYNADAGRFVSMDDWQGNIYDPQTLHKYVYCHNDPVNNLDPSGHIVIPTLAAVLCTAAITVILGMIFFGIVIWTGTSALARAVKTYSQRVTPSTLGWVLRRYGGIFDSAPYLADRFASDYGTAGHGLYDAACGKSAAKTIGWVETQEGKAIKHLHSTPNYTGLGIPMLWYKKHRWQDRDGNWHIFPFTPQYASFWAGLFFYHQVCVLKPRGEAPALWDEWVVVLDNWLDAPARVYNWEAVVKASWARQIGKQGGV